MNYTDKEIEIIKQKAYDKGTRDGVVIATLIFTVFLYFLGFIIHLK
jgi:hypothetical protein